MHCAPTEPGWYWWTRTEELVKTCIVEVTRSGNRLVMAFAGDPDLYDLDDFECVWGPRVEP